MIRTVGRKVCPVLGCLRERRGIFCPEHWHVLPHWLKVQIRDGLTPKSLTMAIAEALHQEQGLLDSLHHSIEYPTFTPSQLQGGSSSGEQI